MVEVAVTTAELKERLDEYLARVRDGDTVTVTEGGEPIGRLTPAKAAGRSPVALARLLVDSGIATWGGGSLGDTEPRARLKPGGKTIAEIASELRD